jgi:hypothetical protein
MVAKNDYKGLRKVNIPLFDDLPKNPHTRFKEPSSNHQRAPAASVDFIAEWTKEVVNAK